MCQCYRVERNSNRGRGAYLVVEVNHLSVCTELLVLAVVSCLLELAVVLVEEEEQHPEACCHEQPEQEEGPEWEAHVAELEAFAAVLVVALTHACRTAGGVPTGDEAVLHGEFVAARV